MYDMILLNWTPKSLMLSFPKSRRARALHFVSIYLRNVLLSEAQWKRKQTHYYPVHLIGSEFNLHGSFLPESSAKRGRLVRGNHNLNMRVFWESPRSLGVENWVVPWAKFGGGNHDHEMRICYDHWLVIENAWALESFYYWKSKKTGGGQLNAEYSYKL